MKTSPTDSPNDILSDTLELRCRHLPPLEFENQSWNEIAAAFENAASCQLGQSWRMALQPRFTPAEVRVAWTPAALWIYAKLHDVDIFNAATQLNEDTFLLGDAFEIFLHPLPGEEYFEMHVTPNNQKLQIHLPHEWRTEMTHTRLPEPDFFQSRAHIETTANRWHVLAQIPAHNLIGRNLLPGDQWLFSFSRYDYTRGFKRPILSSTSFHSRPNFHDRHDWGSLIFTE